jgi:hypothetical protein
VGCLPRRHELQDRQQHRVVQPRLGARRTQALYGVCAASEVGAKAGPIWCQRDLRAPGDLLQPPAPAQLARDAHPDRVREDARVSVGSGMKSSERTPRNPGNIRASGEPGAVHLHDVGSRDHFKRRRLIPFEPPDCDAVDEHAIASSQIAPRIPCSRYLDVAHSLHTTRDAWPGSNFPLAGYAESDRPSTGRRPDRGPEWRPEREA